MVILKQKKHYILLMNNGNKKWLFPDIIIEKEKIIIEYNGSFWHGDPNRYNDGDMILHDNVKVKDVWERDKNKKEIYEKLGYKTIVVWGDSFIKNKEECVNNIIVEINNIIKNE